MSAPFVHETHALTANPAGYDVSILTAYGEVAAIVTSVVGKVVVQVASFKVQVWVVHRDVNASV
jgi:hypothetical protein